MKLDKKILRSLSLAFFMSGIIVAGANIFADNPSAQPESSADTENYQVADNPEEESESLDTEENQEDSSQPSNNDNAEDSVEYESEEDTENEDRADNNDTEDEETETNGMTEVVVNPSEDSYSVVDKLVQAGIVENPDEFNEFLDYYDYARRIQPGTKELSPAMSYEEIAQILTTY